MDIYFYGSYKGSQKGFYFSHLEQGKLIETTNLPKEVHQFFTNDDFWLIWQDLDEENLFFPKATKTFFGVRNLQGKVRQRDAYMNMAILGSIEEKERIGHIACQWFYHYEKMRALLFSCLSFDETMLYQLQAVTFLENCARPSEMTQMYMHNDNPLSARGLIHFAVCSYDWAAAIKQRKPAWLWRNPPRQVYSAQDFRQREE